MKTAEFGVPCATPQPGRCRICGLTMAAVEGGEVLEIFVDDRRIGWADETRTLCDLPECKAAARAELGLPRDEPDLGEGQRP